MNLFHRFFFILSLFFCTSFHVFAQSIDPTNAVQMLEPRLAGTLIFNSEKIKLLHDNTFIAVAIDPESHQALGTFTQQGSLETNRINFANWKAGFPPNTKMKGYGFYSPTPQKVIENFNKQLPLSLAGYKNDAFEAWLAPEVALLFPLSVIDITSALFEYTPENPRDPFFAIQFMKDPSTDMYDFRPFNGELNFEQIKAQILSHPTEKITKIFLFPDQRARDNAIRRLKIADLAKTAHAVLPSAFAANQHALFAVSIFNGLPRPPIKWTVSPANITFNDYEDIYLFTNMADARKFYEDTQR